jgi:hypothetical integral membrane protein (TIGR02206 family)
MREFFLDETIGIPFVLFGWIHIMCLTIFFISILYIYNNRHKLETIDCKKKGIIKLGIVIIMFINMKLYYIPLLIYGHYDWTVHLPLHFCFIAGYLFMFALLTNNIKLYKLTYFFAFLGPLPAILWPDLKSGFDSFLFYQYFISHHFFLISNIYIFYAYNYELNINDAKRAFIAANIIFVIMGIFNALFHTNYIMTKELPAHILELYPFLSNINYPVIILQIITIILLVLAYSVINLRNRENKLTNKCLQGNVNLL